MGDVFSFQIIGVAKPAGSKQAFITKEKKAVVVDASGTAGRQWRALVQDAALQRLKEDNIAPPLFPVGTPIMLAITYYLPRPKSHFNSRGELKAQAPKYHCSKPDALKLTRAIEDALTGICWHDDGQIAAEVIIKRYTNGVPFVEVTVRELSSEAVLDYCVIKP